MMNSLEARLAALKLTWTRRDDAFTTVHIGFGFVIYYRDDRNWLVVLSKEITAEQLRVHATESPKLTGFWRLYNGHYTARMFEIPVTEEFLVHVIESAFPEMLTL